MAVLNSALGICFIEVKREAAVYKFQWMNTNYSEWKLQMQHQQIVLMSGKKKKGLYILCCLEEEIHIAVVMCQRQTDVLPDRKLLHHWNETMEWYWHHLEAWAGH